MINNKKLLILAGAAALSAGTYSAYLSAATEPATATANVITTLTLANTADLSFGDITHNGAIGTVTVAPGGGISSGGNATAMGTGTVSAASYNVTGDGNRAYVITLPNSATISDNTTGLVDITVNAFLDNYGGTAAVPAAGALTGGADTLTVGATLNFVGTEPADTYTGTFDVTINYQ